MVIYLILKQQFHLFEFAKTLVVFFSYDSLRFLVRLKKQTTLDVLKTSLKKLLCKGHDFVFVYYYMFNSALTQIVLK